MWDVKKLTAVDERGNVLELDGGKLRIILNNGKRLQSVRAFDFDGLEPGLSVAVDDLIKRLSGVVTHGR